MAAAKSTIFLYISQLLRVWVPNYTLYQILILCERRLFPLLSGCDRSDTLRTLTTFHVTILGIYLHVFKSSDTANMQENRA